jgi:hypothetical protein
LSSLSYINTLEVSYFQGKSKKLSYTIFAKGPRQNVSVTGRSEVSEKAHCETQAYWICQGLIKKQESRELLLPYSLP